MSKNVRVVMIAIQMSKTREMYASLSRVLLTLAVCTAYLIPGRRPGLLMNPSAPDRIRTETEVLHHSEG